MKHLLIVAAIAVIAAPAFAGTDVLPETGSDGMMYYNIKSGQSTPADESTRRFGALLWSCTQSTGSFFGSSTITTCLLDWADVTNNITVGGLGYAISTNSQASDGQNVVILLVYANDNGYGTSPKKFVQGYYLDNFPGSSHPINEFWGWNWRLEGANPFSFSGNDLDGDGLADFSYVYWQKVVRTPGARMGPRIAGPGIYDPNNPPPIPPLSAGMEDRFDWYAAPDLNNDVNMLNNQYYGTYYFTSGRFAQFYWEMLAPGCPNPGAHFKYCQADIGNYNCIVDLADLAQLLGNYGITSGASYAQGDIEPPDDFFPGDGDVDLGDLAELLGQYGDNCNNP